MAKVKLNLDSRDDDNLRDFAQAHSDAMDGNANFPAPDPTAVDFDAALAGFAGKLGEIALAEAALKTLFNQKDELRGVLEGRLTLRGDHVDKVANGVESIITSAALGVRATPVPTTSLDKVENLTGSAGDNEGEVDLGWNGNIKGRRGFFVEMREDVAGSAWALAKTVTRSGCTIEGLTPGKRYLFRVRAFGPDEIVGPWSDEAQQRCP